MAVAIRAENLGKCYHIYPSQRARFLELLSGGRLQRHRELWAVRGFELEMQQGDVLGVVGDNGAGKSTLLKLMTETTVPTEGTLEVHGRVGALLELGVGFHPEFTGRDNARLTASVMGLSDAELDDAEPRIAEFSELGEFLDQPVKFYSSGMVVRLGFAIAASINPDVLVIDEALSVGDQYFQKKSLDRILQFREEGKTILFCSHGLYQLRNLCPRIAWLEKGRVRMLGDADAVLTAYENYSREREATIHHEHEEVTQSYTDTKAGKASINTITVRQDEAVCTGSVARGAPLEIAVHYSAAQADGIHVAVGFERNDHIVATAFSTNNDGLPPIQEKDGEIRCRIDPLQLLPGQYKLTVVLLDEEGYCIYDRRDQPLEVTGARTLMGMYEQPHLWQGDGVETQPCG